MGWRECLLTSDIIELRSGTNSSVNEISYIKSVLDLGIYLWVIHSVNEEINKLIESLYDNDQSLNARDVLNYLKDKFADMKVRGNVEFIGQFNKMQNMNIDELVEWVQKCTSSMLKFS